MSTEKCSVMELFSIPMSSIDILHRARFILLHIFWPKKKKEKYHRTGS